MIEQKKTASIVKIVGFCLSISAVIVPCCISFSSKIPIPIANPVILILASLFILVPFKSGHSKKTLQKIIGLYTIGVLVNELSSQHFQISYLPLNISVSVSVVILSLCAIGFLAGKVEPTNTLQKVEKTNILHSWVLALVVIIVHMMLLTLVLMRFYGYGYERNLNVLGNLCLYLLLFIFLWERLDGLRFRQCTGLILAIFYAAVTFTKR